LPSDDIGTLTGSSTDYSEARAINASGRIGGASTSSLNQTNAFIKPPVIASTASFQSLGHLGGNYAVVTSINNRGQAVGWSKDSLGQAVGFLIQPNGTLQSLDGMLFYNSLKNIYNPIITDDGKIAGIAMHNDPNVGWTQRGFLVTPQ
jgi:uncharacterized membrane protein